MLVTSKVFGRAVFGAEAQRREHRRIGFGDRRRRILEVLDDGALALAARDRAEAGEAELVADVVAGLDRVVEEFERDRGGDAGEQAEAQAERAG